MRPTPARCSTRRRARSTARGSSRSRRRSARPTPPTTPNARAQAGPSATSWSASCVPPSVSVAGPAAGRTRPSALARRWPGGCVKPSTRSPPLTRRWGITCVDPSAPAASARTTRTSPRNGSLTQALRQRRRSDLTSPDGSWRVQGGGVSGPDSGSPSRRTGRGNGENARAMGPGGGVRDAAVGRAGGPGAGGRDGPTRFHGDRRPGGGDGVRPGHLRAGEQQPHCGRLLRGQRRSSVRMAV